MKNLLLVLVLSLLSGTFCFSQDNDEYKDAIKKMMVVPAYQKQLTSKDIKGLSAFYETPLGKKFAEKTLLISKESMDVGKELGMKIGQKIVDQM